MEIVTCPACGTRVAVTAEGRCPACRGPCTEEPADALPGESEASPTAHADAAGNDEDMSQESLQTVIEQIRQMLSQEALPSQCVACGTSVQTVCDINVDTSDVFVVLPIAVCRRCHQRPPFTAGKFRLERAILPVALLLGAIPLALTGQWPFAAGCLAAAVTWLVLARPAARGTARDRSLELGRLVSKVPVYERLLRLNSEVLLAATEPCYARQLVAAADARRFEKGVQFRHEIVFLGSEEEFSRSRIPPPVAHALPLMIEQRVGRFLKSITRDEVRAVQVSCAILPGKRNAFEIQGLSDEHRRQLLSQLSSLPSWPVAYPFVFAVRRRVGRDSQRGSPAWQPPFASWWRALALAEPSSFAEMALQYHHVEADPAPLEVTLADVEAIRAEQGDSVGLAVYHAQLLLAFERHDEALSICDRLIEQHPEESYFRHLRTSAYESAGQLERAAAECQQILADFPGDAATLGFLAHLQLEMERPEDALRTVSDALAREAHPRLHFVRARIRIARGELDQALQDLDIVLAADADLPAAYVLRARLHLHQQRYDDAIADLDQFHARAGRTVESVFLRATACRAEEDLEQAIATYDEALAEAPGHPLLMVQRAELLAESGKLELARSDCETVLAEHPDFAPAYSIRAAVQLESGDHEPAASDAERAVELGLENAQVFLVLGLASAAGGDPEQAESHLTRALDVEPQNIFALFHRARLRATAGDLAAAVDDASAALSYQPDWVDGLVQRGFFHLAMEQPDLAMEDFERAIQIAPGTAEAYRGRAALRAEQGDRRDALADLNKAVLLDPDNAACRLARTNLLLSEDEHDAAKADLDSALQLHPDLLPALFQRAHLHLSLGEHDAARRDFDLILEQAPDAVPAFIGRSVAWEQVGDHDAADRDASEAVQAAPQDAEQLQLARLLLGAYTAQNNQQFDKAIELATEAIELDAENVDAFQCRAAAHWYSEQYVEALEDYSHVISNEDEPAPEPYSGRGQVHAEMGEFEKALEDLDRAVELARGAGSGSLLAYALNGRGRALVGLQRYEEAETDFVESLQLKPDNAWLHFNRGLLFLARQEPDNAAACFELALSVDRPPLTPKKQARARGFLRSVARPADPDRREAPDEGAP